MDINKDEQEPKSAHSVAIGGNALNSNIISGNHNTIISKIITHTEQERAGRNRRAMLEVVQNTWVKGVLEKSLYHETLIDLGIEERPDAVTRPWDVQVQMPNQPNRTLPPGTPIAQVFDEMQGELLILGAPGAGKTTMLLELARDCIARAWQDDSLPIPVVFNLSSYTDPKQSLDTWLVNELINKYHTPKKVAQGWVEHDEILLLLDGLDEVRAEYREACVQTINAFRQAHGLTMPLVVCSRIADYEALTTCLQLRGAVFLQPLTDRQIDDYFTSVGPELSAVRLAWQNDAELQELARQPLMLSIMTLAYRGTAPKALSHEQTGSLSARRTHLFDAYIQQMFVRVGRTKDERYTPEETTGWLTWLAQKMIEHGQSVFLLENMRRSWMTRGQRWLHRLIGSFLVGLLFGLLDLFWRDNIFFAGLGVIFGLEFGMVGGLVFGAVGGLVFGVVSRLASGVTGGVELVVIAGLARGVVNGVMGGLVGILAGGRMNEVPIERLRWSWTKARNMLIFGVVLGQICGVVFGQVFTLVLTVIVGLTDGLTFGHLVFGLFLGLISGLLYGLVIGLVGGLVLGLVSGFEGTFLETKIVPNQGIQQSFKNGLVYGLGFGLLLALLFGLAGIWLTGLTDRWLAELAGIPFFVTFFFLIYGGSAVINHYILRFLLYRNHHIPRNYEHFLNYAVEHLFLHQIGGGFVFVHRLLLEHFAALTLEQTSPKKSA